MLEKFAIFGNVQPQLQPHLAQAIHSLSSIKADSVLPFLKRGIRISCAGKTELEPAASAVTAKHLPVTN